MLFESRVFWFAAAVRVIFTIYGEWQDANCEERAAGPAVAVVHAKRQGDAVSRLA